LFSVEHFCYRRQRLLNLLANQMVPFFSNLVQSKDSSLSPRGLQIFIMKLESYFYISKNIQVDVNDCCN